MTTLVLLLRLSAVLALFRLLGWPIARLALPGLKAASWALSTTTGLVIAAHATWLLGQAGMRLGPLAIGLGVAVLAVLAALALAALRRAGESATPPWREVLAHALCFTLALALALAITARNPAVDPDSERPMDYAMVSAVLASRSLPLEDPWLAGERVVYYDYGYYATAHLALLVGAPLSNFFPVAVALLHTALLAGCFALGRDLAGTAGGFLAAWFVALAGNLDAAFQTLRPGGLARSLNWFQSARVVEGAITEFPIFTLLWGDLHPYALALPLWPLLVAVAAVSWRGGAGLATALTGSVAFAALLATHTWDAVPIAALLVLAALAGTRPGLAGLRLPAIVIGLGCLLGLPFLLHAPTGGRGLAVVASPSTLAELALAWGAPVLILIAAALAEAASSAEARDRGAAVLLLLGALVIALLDAPGRGLTAGLAVAFVALAVYRRSFAWGLAAIGGGLVAGVEWLYVDDFYGADLARMNTVFKAYVEAWVLLGLAASLHLAALLGRQHAASRARRVAVLTLLVVTLSATAFFPLRGIPARSGSLLRPQPLDATAALRERFPDDAAAIDRLLRSPRGVVLETTGEPYTWNGRFATFTGYPTVLGWGHHEAGWRNQWQPMLDRAREIKDAYGASSLEPLTRLCARHAVSYVVVGELEREQYPPEALVKFTTLRPLLSAGRTVVYEAPR